MFNVVKWFTVVCCVLTLSVWVGTAVGDGPDTSGTVPEGSGEVTVVAKPKSGGSNSPATFTTTTTNTVVSIDIPKVPTLTTSTIPTTPGVDPCQDELDKAIALKEELERLQEAYALFRTLNVSSNIKVIDVLQPDGSFKWVQITETDLGYINSIRAVRELYEAAKNALDECQENNGL